MALVLLVLPVVLLTFRRGIVPVVLVGAMGVGEDVLAAENSWFQTADQAAYRALREGRSEDAVERFEDPAWQAIALYRAEEYEAAARLRRRERGCVLQPGHCARSGHETARSAGRAPQRALELDPSLEDARDNLDVVERLMEEQKPDSENEQGSQARDPNSEGNESALGSVTGSAVRWATAARSSRRTPRAATPTKKARNPNTQRAISRKKASRKGRRPRATRCSPNAPREQEQPRASSRGCVAYADEPGGAARRRCATRRDRGGSRGACGCAPQIRHPW